MVKISPGLAEPLPYSEFLAISQTTENRVGPTVFHQKFISERSQQTFLILAALGQPAGKPIFGRPYIAFQFHVFTTNLHVNPVTI